MQTVYAVKVRPREAIMQERSRQDYYEIVARMSGEQAAPTLAEWQAQRSAAGKPPKLQ